MVVDACCPHCGGDIWITVAIEPAEDRPKEPEPYVLGSEVEDFIIEAVSTHKLTYGDTGRLLVALRVPPAPGKSWHAHTIRAYHRRALARREERYRERMGERF